MTFTATHSTCCKCRPIDDIVSSVVHFISLEVHFRAALVALVAEECKQLQLNEIAVLKTDLIYQLKK